MQILGIDIGFGFTKATSGTDTIIFKSLLGDAGEIQYWADFGDSRPADHIHVTIDASPISSAISPNSNPRPQVHSGPGETHQRVRSRPGPYRSRAADPERPQVNVPVNLVSGLPIGYSSATRSASTGC